VRVLDVLLYGDAGTRELTDHPHFDLVLGDIRNIDSVIRSLNGIDIVIDLAAIVGDPACALDADTTYGSNFEATKVLLDLCELKGVRRFVFASSCSVYGSNPDLMLNEGSWLNPLSLYAHTRVLSEEAILASHRSVEPVILRLATVFGMSSRPRFDLVVNTMTARAVVYHRIEVRGGSQWRPNLHVQDAAEAFILAAEAPQDKVARQIFNVGSTDLNLTIQGMADVVASVVPGTRIDVMPDVADGRDYRVDFEKIRQLLEFHPAFTIENGVREIKEALETGQIDDFNHPVYHNVKQLEEQLRVTVALQPQVPAVAS
jgi:nucleoside-diphosphate-sugar epimerase